MKKINIVSYIAALLLVISLIGCGSQSYPALIALVAFGIGICVSNINKLK